MGRKRIAVSSSGGIAAGTPFAVGQYLYVQQASPPVAIGGRLVQVTPADATASITCVGPGAGTDSFVMGRASSDRGQARSVILGTLVLAGGAAPSVGSVMIGYGIDAGAANGNAENLVCIGNGITLNSANSIGGSICIGSGITQAVIGAFGNAGAIAIGPGVQVGLSGIAIGNLAKAGGESVTIGRNVGTTAMSQATTINASGPAGDKGTAIGWSQGSSIEGISIGFGALSGGTSSVTIGYSAYDGGFAECVVLGKNALATVANTFIVGASGNVINLMRVGAGVTHAAGYGGLTFASSQSPAGVDQVAANTTFAAGANTGLGAGGILIFQTGTIVGTGAARQALAERLAILPSTGGAAGPILRFSNYTSGAAAAAGTLLNAPVAGNPATWIPVIDALGAVRYIPAW